MLKCNGFQGCFLIHAPLFSFLLLTNISDMSPDLTWAYVWKFWCSFNPELSKWNKLRGGYDTNLWEQCLLARDTYGIMTHLDLLSSVTAWNFCRISGLEFLYGVSCRLCCSWVVRELVVGGSEHRHGFVVLWPWCAQPSPALDPPTILILTKTKHLENQERKNWIFSKLTF